MEFLGVGDAAVEALAAEDAEFNFGPAFIQQPQLTAVFGCVMNFQFVDESAGFLGREGGVQRGPFVGVEIVLNEHDLFRVEGHDIDQMTDGVGVIEGGALVRHEALSRRPSNSANSMKMLAVPLRAYS